LLTRLQRTPTGVIAGAAAVVWLLSAFYMFHFGSTWHLDLRVYRAAENALFHGGTPFRSDFTANRLPFTYTPFALLALSPVAYGALGLVESLWWLISVACLVGAFYLMLTTAFALPALRAWAVSGLACGVATLALEPVRSNLNYGQINLILLLMVVADLTRVRPPWRGLLVGLAAAVKLTPLVYLSYFALAKEWRSLLRGVGAFVGVTALSWAVLPGDSTLYWFHEVSDAGRTGNLAGVSNQSWNGLVHRAPFDGGHGSTVLWLVLSLATLAAGLVLTRWLIEGTRPVEAVIVLAITEVLISPVSWSHHWSWLALAPVAVVSVWRIHRVVAYALGVLVALGVAAPYLWVRWVPLSYVGSNALVLGGAAVLAIWLAAEARRRRQSPTPAPAIGAASEPLGEVMDDEQASTRQSGGSTAASS
jgi:alpha-1,2-mannosyltransferase